ncbi:FMN-binding negative transcriptional regulator [soil metagenome]
MRAIVLREGMVHLFATTPDGPMVAHVPVTMTDDGNFRFHLARSNRIAPHLNGARVVGSVMGAHGYISPDWYADVRNQVPTWNYIAVEIDGTVAELDRTALVEQIAALAAYYENGLAPKPAWTLATLDPARREAMLDALCIFELKVEAMRGTAKFSQNKNEADRAGVHDALKHQGNDALAAMMVTA